MDLHNKIMNIQVDDKSLNEVKEKVKETVENQVGVSANRTLIVTTGPGGVNGTLIVTMDYLEMLTMYAYKLGHRDARHKAAELLLETEEKG